MRRLCGPGCAGYVVVGGWLVQTNYIARLGLSQVSQSGPSVAKRKLNHGNNGHLSFPVTHLLKTTLVPIIFICLGSEACDWA